MTTTCTFSFDDLDNFEAFSSRLVAAFQVDILIYSLAIQLAIGQFVR